MKEVPFSKLSPEIQSMFRRLQIKHEAAKQYHRRFFGHAPSVHGVTAYGRMQVAVAGSIYQCSDPNTDWAAPSDFFVSYLKSSFGDEWLDGELAKQYEERHEVARWYTKGVSNLENNASTSWGKPNGKALALLHLAYDLFTLESTLQLPNFIFERLRNKQGFNGARYEVFVFSTLVRAGFSLAYTEERSGLHGRVTECLATHTATQEVVYVEAKTRNIKGVLGSAQGRAKKIRIYDKLKDAMGKGVNGPYLIFLDINHPNILAVKGNRELEKVRSEYGKLEANYKNEMPNLVCFTNIPFHYGSDDQSPNRNLIGFMMPNLPKRSLQKIVLMDIHESLKKYDYLPKEFQEGDAYADGVADAVMGKPDRSRHEGGEG